MVYYKCDICDKVFSQKCHYLYHTTKRKKSCEPNLKSNLKTNPKTNPKGNPKYKCIKCHKFLTTKSNLNRHIKKHCIYKNNDHYSDRYIVKTKTNLISNNFDLIPIDSGMTPNDSDLKMTSSNLIRFDSTKNITKYSKQKKNYYEFCM
jgi:hypothetical protein